MTVTLSTPTLETDRLVLRAPQMRDVEAYIAFKMSDRSIFTDGPISRTDAGGAFSQLLGEWAMRGYGLFFAAPKDAPDTIIGGFGVFHPLRHAEPEFGWSLYDANAEGNGYVIEAMRTIIPWAWTVLGVDTAQSHIHEGNAPSIKVAEKLDATFDAETTAIANAIGGEFHTANGPYVNIWRHYKGALT